MPNGVPGSSTIDPDAPPVIVQLFGVLETESGGQLQPRDDNTISIHSTLPA